MKYIRFDSRLRGTDLELGDILVHAVSLLDHAAAIAIEDEDLDALDRIFERMMDANDRLIAIAYSNSEEQEEENEQLEKPKFGFFVEQSSVDPVTESGIDCEEDGTDG